MLEGHLGSLHEERYEGLTSRGLQELGVEYTWIVLRTRTVVEQKIRFLPVCADIPAWFHP
jgi:hypothetical protein